ncbi:MAG: phage N-6-adenine-methyltransferase [Alphaproteobacteria bacterium]
MVKKSPKRETGEAWYTPAWLFDLLCEANGAVFDLDPCAPPEDRARPNARRSIIDEGGLSAEWTGAVVMDPQHGRAPVERWVDKAMRAVHWDKTAHTVVAFLPVMPTAPWWVTYVRGWASVLLVRGRLRIGGDHAGRSPFVAAVAVWSTATARFVEHVERQPRSVLDGVWLPAYRADSNAAPFLRSLTTRARMQKLYGSYDDFRKNLAAWTQRMPPDYADVLGTALPGEVGDAPDARPSSKWHVNRYGYVTRVKGRPIFWKTLQQ